MGEAAGPWRKLAARAARVQELEFRILGRQAGPRPAIIFRESSLDRIFAPHGSNRFAGPVRTPKRREIPGDHSVFRHSA